MTKEQSQTTSGIGLSGTDDAFYFIPDADLEAYRLADEAATQVRRLLAQQSDTQGYALPLPPPRPVADLPVPMPRVFLPLELVRFRGPNPVALTPENDRLT